MVQLNFFQCLAFNFILNIAFVTSFSSIFSHRVIRNIARSSTAVFASDFALLFDCDGVIVETEELHRVAYNKAFDKFGLQLPDGSAVEWTVDYYDILQNTVGGGKPKMKHYFNNEVKAWPACRNPYSSPPTIESEQSALVDKLQDAKTEFYKEIVEDLATARPGVLELMDEAIADPTIKVGICSAATKAGFVKIVDAVVGQERLSKLDVVMAGDDVTEKKPHPMIYNTAKDRLGLSSDNCVVIEDSMVGLRAAKSANMRCIITYTHNTASEDFYGEGADAKVPDLSNVKLQDIFEPLKAGSSEILEHKRDVGKISDSAAAKVAKTDPIQDPVRQ